MEPKYFFLIFVILLFSCNDEKSSNNEDIINSTNNIEAETKTVNYSVIQSTDSLKNKETLIVVIDPHGSGTTALLHFNDVVENFDCTIIGLNNVMNNQTDFIEKITENINTAIENLDLNIKHLFIVGFSGGARMAFMYSSVKNVSGILMCGAGARATDYYNVSFPLALIIGIRDFNFGEHYYSPNTNLASNMNILSLVFDGKHEWPPNEQINQGMAFLFARNGIGSDDATTDYKQIFDDYVADKNYVFAYKTIEAAYKSTSGDEQLEAKQLFDNLKSSSEFKNYIADFEQTLNSENRLVGDYLKVLQPKDMNWWTNEITEIKNQSNSTDPLIANSNHRILGYLGIVMYSYTKKELKNPQSVFIDKYLQIYELLEPENADLWFFKAVRERNRGNSQLTGEYLQKAYDLGFADMNTSAEFGM